MMVSFITPVMDVNTGQYRTSVRNIATGVRTKVTGLTGEGAPTSDLDLVERLILTGVAPDVDAHIWVGWHPLVAANILDRYFDMQVAGLHQIPFSLNPAPMTEAFMIERMKQKAREHGCERFWLVRPGDSLTTSSPADLLSRFVPFT